MTTSTEIQFGLYDLEVKQDSDTSCPDLQAFANIEDLETGASYNYTLATYEQDFWRLNGNYKFVPFSVPAYDYIHVGLFSLSMSDYLGDFDIPPVLTIDFSEDQDTEGLVLTFLESSGDYANDINIKFYNSGAGLITDDDYTPTSWKFSTDDPVSAFRQIVITFNSTAEPFRFMKLRAIDYGTILYFTNADIRSATIVEEINQLSLEMPYNELDILLYSEDALFSFINPSGYYNDLQERQPIDVYETVNGVTIYMGRFYLTEWDNPSIYAIHMRAMDVMGVLDKVPYIGNVWGAATLTDIVSGMLTPLGIPFVIHPDIELASIVGDLSSGSCRYALQQSLFETSGFATCARNAGIRFLPFVLVEDVTDYDYALTNSDMAQPVTTLKDLVTRIDLESYNYYLGAAVQVFNKTLAIGTHEILFESPLGSGTYSVGGAALSTPRGAYNVTIIVSVEGPVTISAQPWEREVSITPFGDVTLDGTLSENSLKIGGVGLISGDTDDVVVERIYDYYQQRIQNRSKVFAHPLSVGDFVTAESLYGQDVAGVVEKMEIDLAGGFTSRPTINGILVAE